MPWHDALDIASATTAFSNVEAAMRQVVTCGTTGTCTKLRVGIYTSNFAANMKMALYNASFALIGQSTRAGVNSAGMAWEEFTLAVSVAVTSATTYYIAVAKPSDGQMPGHNTSGNALLDFTGYASHPLNPFSGADNVTQTLAVGMWVDPAVTAKPWIYRSHTHTLGAGLGTAK